MACRVWTGHLQYKIRILKPFHCQNHAEASKRPLNRSSYPKRKTSLKESKSEVSGICLYLCWRITRWCSHPLKPLSLQLCLPDIPLHLKWSGFDARLLCGVHAQGKVLFWFLMGRISRRWRTVNHAETERQRFFRWWGSGEEGNEGMSPVLIPQRLFVLEAGKACAEVLQLTSSRNKNK